MVDALEALLNRRPRLPPAALEVALTAAAKLTARLPSQVCVRCTGGGGWWVGVVPVTTAPECVSW